MLILSLLWVAFTIFRILEVHCVILFTSVKLLRGSQALVEIAV